MKEVRVGLEVGRVRQGEPVGIYGNGRMSAAWILDAGVQLWMHVSSQKDRRQANGEGGPTRPNSWGISGAAMMIVLRWIPPAAVEEIVPFELSRGEAFNCNARFAECSFPGVHETSN